MLTASEWAVIDQIDQLTPYIKQNFVDALEVPREERYEWAMDRVYEIKRKRYTKRGVPEHDTETVGEHLLEAVGLATIHTPEHCLRDTVEQMIVNHDLLQAILDNLKCEEALTTEQKQQAAQLAAKVVFENEPKAYALWQEYAQGQSAEARVAKDIQHAQMLIKISEYERSYPMTRSNFKSYWETLDTAWVSDIGRSLQETLFGQMTRAANDDHADFGDSSSFA